ncbi:hypothetical protein K040078D81_44790 [Blautia hominis]|uniref:Uncharacterized protein n=1 Tax=Blautia hominis TaxID=2025493 RepID=A0ABQ0BFZ8_9FIRM
MALTKLMHMKQSGSRKPSRHLKNGIEYIMKENKTEGGQWIGGGRYNKVTLKKVSKIKCFRSFSQHRNEALLP